jgi:hypothetical protein
MAYTIDSVRATRNFPDYVRVLDNRLDRGVIDAAKHKRMISKLSDWSRVLDGR